MPPESVVRYTNSGDVQIAYRVIGDGPRDIMVVFEWASNLDLSTDDPRVDRFLRRFAEYGRLIVFDIRGSGLSDPVDRLPPMEEWVDDIRAVLSAVGSERTALVGQGHAGQLCMVFTAMYPETVSALVTLNSFARLRRGPGYPPGHPPAVEAAMLEVLLDGWGTGQPMGWLNPGMAEGAHGPVRLARVERAGGSPRRAALKQRLVYEIDVRDVLSAITVPTLVVHTRDNPYIRRDHAAYLVDHIQDSRYVELPGGDYSPYASREADALMDAVEEFLTGTPSGPATDRALMTVAFTDIVGSTELATSLGDRSWRSLLEIHEHVSRREIENARGRLVKLTGDGLMATFDGPARAVTCVQSIGDILEPLGVRIRAGVHTGEVERVGDDIGGIGVHIAARISGLAVAGEVLVSSTVRDLVAGSGIAFEDRDEQVLKGVNEPWRVFAAR